MWQKEKKDSLIAGLGLFMALTATGVAVVSHESESALAESSSEFKKASFPLPDGVPNDTKIRIDGSNSVASINQALKQGFEKKFPGTNVEIATNGSQQALKDLLDGKIDIAAISRGLTPEEKAKGLEQLRLRREKIAVIVSKENPFQGSITNEQFAKVFRGEITDWSQLGGAKGKIRLIDHPETSETRESFRSYPVFQKAEFKTGANTNLLDSYHAVEVIKNLGKDGIGYVIANQVSQLDGVRILQMHQTLPGDSKYPYSQPLVYVYKQKPGSAIASFLGFSTATPGQKAIESARKQEAETVKNLLLAGVNTENNASPSQNQTDTTANTDLLDADAKPTVTKVSDSNSNNARENTTALTASNGLSDSNSRRILVPSDPDATTSTTGIPLWLWLLVASISGSLLLWFFAFKGRRGRNGKEELESESDVPLDTVASGRMATAAALGTVGSGMGAAAHKLKDKEVSRVSNSNALNVGNNFSSTAGGVSRGSSGELESETATLDDLPDTAIGNNSSQKKSLQVDEAEWNLEAPAAIVNNSIPQVAGIGKSTADIKPVVGSAEVDITCESDEREENSSTFDKNGGAVALAAGLAATAGTQKELSQFAQQDTDTSDPNSSTITDGSLPSVQLTSKKLDVEEKTSSDINQEQLPTVRIKTSGLEELNTDNSEVNGNTNMATNELPNVEITNTLTENTSKTNEQLPTSDVVSETAKPAIESAPNLIGNVTATGATLIAGVGLGSKLSEQDSQEVAESTDVTTDLATDVETNIETNTSVPKETYPPLPDVWDEVLLEETKNHVDVTPDLELPNASQEKPDDVGNIAQQSSETTDEVITDVISDVVTTDVTPDAVSDEVITDRVTHEVTHEEIADVAANAIADEVTDEETTDVVPDRVAHEVITDGVTHEINNQGVTDVRSDAVSVDVATDEQATDEQVTTENVTDEEIKTENVTDEQVTNEELTTENVISVNSVNLTSGVAAVGAGTTIASMVRNNDTVNDELPDSEVETAIVLTPRTPKWAYTAWEISTADKQQLLEQSDSQLILRLYDVTDVDLSYQIPHLVQQYECEISINHRYVAIPKGDRNYMVEIGYLSNDRRWLSLTRSEITRVASRPHQDFWFEADAELIIHGATEPGATVTIAGNQIKVKPNGTFHLRIPFTEEVMEYLMMSSAANSNKSKTISMKFTQEKPEF